MEEENMSRADDLIKYQTTAPDTIIRKIVKNDLLPNSQPNAIPGFSTNSI